MYLHNAQDVAHDIMCQMEQASVYLLHLFIRTYKMIRELYFLDVYVY